MIRPTASAMPREMSKLYMKHLQKTRKSNYISEYFKKKRRIVSAIFADRPSSCRQKAVFLFPDGFDFDFAVFVINIERKVVSEFLLNVADFFHKHLAYCLKTIGLIRVFLT